MPKVPESETVGPPPRARARRPSSVEPALWGLGALVALIYAYLL